MLERVNLPFRNVYFVWYDIVDHHLMLYFWKHVREPNNKSALCQPNLALLRTETFKSHALFFLSQAGTFVSVPPWSARRMALLKADIRLKHRYQYNLLHEMSGPFTRSLGGITSQSRLSFPNSIVSYRSVHRILSTGTQFHGKSTVDE